MPKFKLSMLKVIPYIIAIASAIAALTPNESDDKLVSSISQVVNMLGLNVGHAKNETHTHDLVQ